MGLLKFLAQGAMRLHFRMQNSTIIDRQFVQMLLRELFYVIC